MTQKVFDMKRLLFSVLAAFVSFSTQAALTSWGAASSSSLSGSYVGGTAYLIEVSASGPSMEAMIVAIKQNGLGQSSSYVTLKAQGGIEENSGERLVEGTDFVNSGVDTSATYYVLFVDSTGQNFLFSNGMLTSDNGFDYNLNPPIETANPFFEEREGEWGSNGGTIGSSVPEPTALALLALGVAGWALKRRVA